MSKLGTSEVELITLKEKFLTAEVCSNELFVRECMRGIFDSINEFRTSGKHHAPKAAVVGQPGIGKTCSLYYFAYKFLQEDDLDLVVIQNYESQFVHIFCDNDDLITAGDHMFQENNMKSLLQKKLDSLGNKAVLLVDMSTDEEPNEVFRLKGLTVF